MRLKLTKPIVFFDLETTGLNIASDRIVELSYHKLYPNGSSESKTYRINPEMHIPEATSAIHGITDDDVRDCPVFAQIAKEVVHVLEGCDIAGYNSNSFDVPLLAEELIRAGSDFDLKRCRFIDAYIIFTKNEPRNLSAAYRFYCGKSLENAHSANADTEATYEVLMAQLEKYDNLPDTVEGLAEYTSFNRSADFTGKIVYDKEGVEIFNFGKYKGQRVRDLLQKDTGYYGWLMQGEFPQYMKKVITRIFVESRKKGA